jgi:hypothetical protein
MSPATSGWPPSPIDPEGVSSRPFKGAKAFFHRKAFFIFRAFRPRRRSPSWTKKILKSPAPSGELIVIGFRSLKKIERRLFIVQWNRPLPSPPWTFLFLSRPVAAASVPRTPPEAEFTFIPHLDFFRL